ncbi:hypothetical protein Dtox_0382 [Desulfofarcimen acetoxidans DSM 771]|uniref:Uncharacterized protein n=1 Tax=Desulfofarcimen acetoxidans (strain ATCC 49208 / DSM 771 / KCTC 5769 / VKM B-1644 / 5575) TaxID=485916 RepID=C8W4X5_DESAS|nr:hypothetical protein [Desulfofarcimen acetoxidans]ACV61327.1 hypothetical protein Dtox_0382 [Desulfofarcimen acetoxidans DSM 771]
MVINLIFLRDVIILLSYTVVIFYLTPRVVLITTGLILFIRTIYYLSKNYVNEKSFRRVCDSLPNKLKNSNEKIDIIKKYILHTKAFKGIFVGIISIILGYFNVPLFKNELEQFLLGNYFPLPTLIITVALINNLNYKNDLIIIKRKLSGDSTIWLELTLILLAVVILIALTSRTIPN